WRKRRDAGSGGGRGDPGVPAVARPKLTSSSPTRPLTTMRSPPILPCRLYSFARLPRSFDLTHFLLPPQFSTTTRCSSPPASISLSRVPIKFVDGRGDASAPCEDKAED
uniref:Uncharacterized protein n=1 Tax=Triticum urartu TaxID=4572 RepID=A0A8R7P7C7_TRIUA